MIIFIKIRNMSKLQGMQFSTCFNMHMSYKCKQLNLRKRRKKFKWGKILKRKIKLRPIMKNSYLILSCLGKRLIIMESSMRRKLRISLWMKRWFMLRIWHRLNILIMETKNKINFLLKHLLLLLKHLFISINLCLL
jgi:hypothetical protein